MGALPLGSGVERLALLMPSYYIATGTSETWQETGRIAYGVQGFPERRKKHAGGIKPGDLFLCYLKDPTFRFVAVLKATDPASVEEEPRIIWKSESDAFPVRVETRAVVTVPIDRGIHLRQVKKRSASPKLWQAWIRSSPQKVRDDEREVEKWIVERLHEIKGELDTEGEAGRAWLKIGYHAAAGEDARYWHKLPWISDSPGRRSSWWNREARPRTGMSHPPHGPQYRVGDRLVMYLTGPKKCPAILEVSAKPRWDPDRVDRVAAPGEGDRWGVLTEVKAVAAVPLSKAPPLERLGVAPASIASKGHISLEDWQYEEAERLIGGSSRPPRRDPATAERIPIEKGKVEGYEQAAMDVRQAERREWRLVRDYAATLEAQGDAVSRNKLKPRGSSTTMLTDLFNWTRGQLIEAKASGSRSQIRMAIGQLADYSYSLERSRSIDREPDRAVLLPEKPRRDLIELLEKQDIKVIWQEGNGFADNAGGKFT